MEKIIILIDMNAYFASVEQVCNPALRGKPVAVSGRGYPATGTSCNFTDIRGLRPATGTSHNSIRLPNGLRKENDEGGRKVVTPSRTIVTTVSYEARKYGIKTAMSLPEAKRLCPGLIVVCGDLDKYVDTSLRIHKILLEFTDQVEVFSIDECYLDVTHLCLPAVAGRNGVTPEDIGRKVKKRVKEETGLLCSVGIGPNKTMAKIAAKLQKPDGLVRITEAEIPEFFENFPVEELHGVGIGRKLSEKLQSMGICTAKELGDAPISMLTEYFGFLGYHLKNIGLGKDDSSVKRYSEVDEVKSVGHSYTLPKDTLNLDIIKSYLLMLSEKTGRRLREKKFAGRTVSLVVRYGDFFTFSKQRRLQHCIKTGYDIYFNAYRIFEQILPLKQGVRMLGVSISGLSVDTGQHFLLEELERKSTLTQTVDEINRKFGESTLKPASILTAENFGIYKKIGILGSRYSKDRN
ncbi:MAG: DNA polymerase IV [Elusimicrobiota bacterium]